MPKNVIRARQAVCDDKLEEYDCNIRAISMKHNLENFRAADLLAFEVNL
jgi:hypothetical protein